MKQYAQSSLYELIELKEKRFASKALIKPSSFLIYEVFPILFQDESFYRDLKFWP